MSTFFDKDILFYINAFIKERIIFWHGIPLYLISYVIIRRGYIIYNRSSMKFTKWFYYYEEIIY